MSGLPASRFQGDRRLQGRSLLPAIAGRRLPQRPNAFNAYIRHGVEMKQAMNRRWIYSFWPGGQERPSLIDLRDDPKQNKNVATRHPAVCRRLHAALERWDPEGMQPPATS